MSEELNQLKVAVILSGCGVYDGSEAYETVLTLLRLDEMGVSVSCFAPNDEQFHVINHLSGDENAARRYFAQLSKQKDTAYYGLIGIMNLQFQNKDT